ncbi:type II toxin-antitoxin system RelE/ParE family toxin [Microvirga arsenatis]|uniref:type II toxin-antitoxin system RelE/ParE family toxin n=1 Tax=Microvirga arsenatis TaxID=2692265 RepID=UPI003CCE5778
MSDEDLCEAIARAEKGHIDAEVGKFLIKQRMGRSGDYRAVIVYKRGDRAVFLHIFPKSRKANLSSYEKTVFRDAAKVLANLADVHIPALTNTGEWIEIDYEKYQKDLSERPASISPSGDEGPPQSRRNR